MSQQMGWREAAVEVLKGRPEGLSYTDIAEQIATRKLRTSVGATPAASVNVAISDSIKSLGDKSPFERLARGLYRLREDRERGPSSKQNPKRVSSQDEEEIERKKETTGLINAFGMYWSRDRIDWQSASPQVLGKQTPGSTPVDFSDQRGVYLLYDRGSVVYVGRAIDQGIGTRLKQHTFDRLGSRWDRFSWFGVYTVAESGKLDSKEQNYDRGLLIATMEALLIEAVEPRQNRRRGDDFSAVEFLQFEDPKIEKAKKRALLDQLRETME